ncbi:DUF1285 domain-containing protein [Shewanella sp. Isolate11]|uniref:DUF1285 domain-containing protein n=1 Tax=Shewanella sp. Isolate11 TaxID=2908530 RepID=UPI001EFDC2AF|nr:DUF1285 domain-containing protein [Shewanella sp. Isolate11]MCG9697023.1 DUF1285 domain-containing protein [Shewanella sp. Isolate11]
MAETSGAQSQLHKLTQGVSLCDDEPLFVIDNQGNWFYKDEPLPDKFCRLFASILYAVDGQYFLITPVEKVIVSVAAFPLLIVDYEFDSKGQLVLTTSIGTYFTVESEQHFTVDEQDIFVSLDKGLSAKLGRACYYRFIEQFLLKQD